MWGEVTFSVSLPLGSVMRCCGRCSVVQRGEHRNVHVLYMVAFGNPNPAPTDAMTFALLPRPVIISTGLEVDSLTGFLEQLDEESADCLATELSIRICEMMEQLHVLREFPLIVAYLDDLSEACRAYILLDTPSVDHREMITEALTGFVKRIKLRIWFLYVDTLLYS